MITKEVLIQRQKYPLNLKIRISQRRIKEFYNLMCGKVYISYSGGKDSEVLLHLIKSIYPYIKVVFVDTGMELSTREHAIKKADIILRPKIKAFDIWNKYGIPFPSKQQADFIYKAKHTNSDYLRNRLLTGIMKDGSKTMFKISDKWIPLIKSDIEVSDRCCHYLKKEPFRKFKKQTGLNAYIGTMASDGIERKKQYYQKGCIDLDRGMSNPLGFWTDQDILKYILKFNIDYCKNAYGDIIINNGIYETTKAKRTGCENCLFGIHLEKQPNRLQRLYKDNPRQHNIFLNKWANGNTKKVLDMYNIPYK